jgi:hypothetical protein
MDANKKILLEISKEMAAALISRPVDPNAAKFPYGQIPKIVAKRAVEFAKALIEEVNEADTEKKD